MSSNRKLNFRQNSLICGSPKRETRRNSLKKQSSEDISRNNYLNNEIKVTVNAKCKVAKNDFPKPKLAWGENDVDEIEPITVNKCQEIRKPARQLTRQCSVEQDSILSSKDDLIDKIRLLLKDEQDIPEKQNINIYLNNGLKPSHLDNSVQKYENQIFKGYEAAETYIPESSPANLFQFRKPTNRSIEERNFTPSNVKDTRREPPNILVTPIAEKIDELDKIKNETKNIITNNSQPINNIIIRPSTAASRRDLFKKRTNSAFHSIVKDGSNNRAPLQRSSSAPIRPDHAKSKFLATKRKLKKRDSRTAKKGNSDQIPEDEKGSPGSNKCNSSNISEIETMVSLVSPAASDVEEIQEIETPDIRSRTRNNSPKKPNPITKKDESVPKISSLRKVVKQVSFQQSSIHAIRSFSAGFPGRKHSMVTSLMLSNGANLKRTNTVQKGQEKRITSTIVSDDDERVPKRLMMRSRSAHLQTDSNKEDTDRSITPLPEDHPQDHTNISINIELKLPINMDEGEDDLEEIRIQEPNKIPASKNLEKDKEEKSEVRSQDGHDFTSPKEKECWNLYLKMNNKGVRVNYDTLLRGMLTPTEYRKRRQSLAVAASLENDLEKNPEGET